MCLFLAVPWANPISVIVVFPEQTRWIFHDLYGIVMAIFSFNDMFMHGMKELISLGNIYTQKNN